MTKRVVTESRFERMLDALVIRRLRDDREYNNADNAQQQADREAQLEKDALAQLEAKYQVRPW